MWLIIIIARLINHKPGKVLNLILIYCYNFAVLFHFSISTFFL